MASNSPRKITYQQVLEEDARETNNYQLLNDYRQNKRPRLQNAQLLVSNITGPGQKCEFKLRVASKQEKDTKIGKLLSLILMDENRCYIKGLAWRDMAADVGNRIQVDHVYKITNVSVKEKNAAQQHFSWVTTKWEITFSKFSSVEEVLNGPYFPLLKFEFQKYEDIVQLPMETVIDVIGLFKEEVSRNRNGKYEEYVEMIDTENRKIFVAVRLEGQLPSTTLARLKTILSFKGVKKSHSDTFYVFEDSFVKVDYESPEFESIRAWREGGVQSSNSHTRTIFF